MTRKFELEISNIHKVWKGYRTFSKVGREFLGKHYMEWVQRVKQYEMMEPEFLVPVARVPYHAQAPYSMRLAEQRYDQAAVDQLLRHTWDYYFSLGHGWSTLGPDDTLAGVDSDSRYRTYHRMRMICDGLCELLGGVDGKSMLDMASNWGAFALEFAARGAVTEGVDLREENVLKADALKAHLGIDNASFRIQNVYDLDENEKYDIVLNLGLMYHVTKPYELVRKTYDICRDVAVIETIAHAEPFSGFILGTGSLIPREHASGEIGAELHPTYRGLIDMMYMVGFEEVVELDAAPDPDWADFGSDLFGRKLRRALVGFKKKRAA